MFDFSKLKLVIWDLDETFWNGTISEQDIEVIDDNIKLVKNLTDCGIVNAICSKNDMPVVENKMKELGIWEYFVFPSVNWQPKGSRVKQLISDMALRPANTLFLDDNLLNLNEAKHFCPELMTAGPDELGELYKAADIAEKKDMAHKRLKQYQILQEKVENREGFEDNEEFLKSCNIKVTIGTDCKKYAERLHELLLRSNQINFTKVRPTFEEFSELINNEDTKCGYAEVSDKFGEYGIVGFYAVKDGKLLHFAFSCRTMGMGVEQYIYSQLDYPEITIVEPVSSQLPHRGDSLPYWINQEQTEENTENGIKNSRIIMKGPCDLHQVFSFIRNSDIIEHEFTYMADDGNEVVGYNHTASIVTAMTASEERKHEIIDEVPGLNEHFFDTKLGNVKYDFVFLSSFLDIYSTIYQRKSTGERFALSWENIPKKALNELYDIVDNNDGSVTVENLNKICSLLPKETNIIIILPPEVPYSKDDKQIHIKTSKFNKKIHEWAEGQKNIALIELSKYVDGDDDFIDGYFHYPKRIYYQMTMQITQLLNEKAGMSFESKSKTYLLLRTLYNKVPTPLRAFIDKKIIYRK